MPKEDKRIKLTVKLHEELFREFKIALATQLETTQTALEDAVREYVARHKRKGD